MANFHVNGGLKKGTAIALAACFLLGSSITSLAAGDGVADAYEGLMEATEVMTGATEDEEPELELHSEPYDLDPADVIFMEDGIEPYGSDWELEWIVRPGKTVMSSGFKVYEGGKVAVAIHGTPEEIDFKYGIKDPDAIMWYVEDSGVSSYTFDIDQDGRHYFFVKNLSETEELHVTVHLCK